MTDTVTEVMPAVVVDRSSELRRGVRPLVAAGGESFLAVIEPDGVPGDGGACALARYILANFPEVASTHIEGEHPYLVMKNGSVAPFNMDEYTADWVGRFDRGENPEPLHITMRVTRS